MRQSDPTKKKSIEWEWIEETLSRWIGEAEALNRIPETQKLRACRTQLRALLTQRDDFQDALKLIADAESWSTDQQIARAALERRS